ncbi:hypothetical protein F5B22DRAFT_602919 [Xylaria bambusicola]|uniref:uncharacterized protein n=1 Tax=Xylaria bambusicola TaxID=326684 RepID=UPI0020088A9E|nr:uncharacterized protein F5B22DRAFT_602919 [Xylaria bambusicola]KAI0517433.1 hypothetical protein F5B22DRAFT_602919 [Xylaria bambusicola]
MSPQTGGQIVDLRSEPSQRALNRTYRRNGKLQSCEPCRKSKLRCDHVVPTCSRCVRRKCTDKCVYHPNPLTKKRQTTERPLPTPATTINEDLSPAPLPTIESSEPSSPHSPTSLGYRIFEESQLESQEVPLHAPAKLNRAASAPPLQSHQCRSDQGRVNPGFFGTTNYMAFFSENLGKLGVVSTELEGPKLPRLHISNDQIVRGTQILSFLKDTSLIHDFVNRSFVIGDGIVNVCIEPVMKQWLLKLWANHGDTLKKRNPEKLRRLSELLWHNTLTSIVVKQDMDYKAWAMQATGMNIRWEVIGIIAALVGQCATTLGRSDLLLTQHNVSKPILARRMSEISSACLEFCRDCEALDDLFVWLLTENMALTESIKGAGSYALYRESGEYVNAIVAMGLHIDVKQGKQHIPFFIEQMRTRLVAGAYSVDISISSYLGRPPRLSYRYCNLIPPMDIPDTQLVASEDEIARIIAALDENGFGTSDTVSRATFAKAWVGFAPIREEVLDLSLGRYSREEIFRRAEEIQKKSNDYWENLPLFIRSMASDTYEYNDIGLTSKRPFETLLKITLRQGFRANELLLQRVLIRKTGASWDKLVEAASSIFEDILRVTKRHDLASLLQSNISALLAVSGLRSASVIAVELLKQEQMPNYPKNPLLPRSRTIQDLSVFAARLGDVDPSDGQFTVCDQGRKVITRILDKILSPPSSIERPLASHIPHEQQAEAHASEGMELNVFQSETAPHQEWPPPDPLDFQIGEANWGIDVPFLGNDSDFVQWLENVDWEKPILR